MEVAGSLGGGREPVDSTRDGRGGSHESDTRSPRVAHTLTACCRCRKRKTRCDPNLPRCLRCQRADTTCEYFDTTKNKKIPRSYVIRLQDKIHELEKELSRYTEDNELPWDAENIVRPGGLVRLDEDDETPRFLGASSGIAMTRLVMEQAKKYTNSQSILEIVPEVRDRRFPTPSPEGPAIRNKPYPMISAVAAPILPTRLVTDKLVEVFNQKSQYLWPTLHEPTFAKDLEDVYAGSTDPYQNFVLRMMLAISMQKLDPQYAGLADSYYLAAMAYMEDVVRPKNIKTLQCLVLVAQYSLLTPTRTAIYYVVGLATRLCQQLGLTEEKTIKDGVSCGLVNPIQLDMRRRLFWIVLSMEFGLAQTMGRPNAFATSADHVDVGFFEPKDDEYITPMGISPGPVSEKKILAIHFFRMRLLQAEIRRMLYQKKRPEPQSEQHPWFSQMEKKMKEWLDASPTNPSWSKPWFISKYNTIVVFLFRPSPQVPKPSGRAALLCYDASVYNIKMQSKQMATAAVDITWIFLLAIFMAMNTILWAISYPEVRSLHTKEEFQEYVEIALDIIVKCRDRWPGTGAACHLYSKLAKACAKCYDANDHPPPPSSLSANSPALTDANSPSASEHSSVTTGSNSNFPSFFQTQPWSGHIFGQSSEDPRNHEMSMHNILPSFRSNSIFANGTNLNTDRRFSYFPPDFTQPQTFPDAWNPMVAPTEPPSGYHLASPIEENITYFTDGTPFGYDPQLYSDNYSLNLRHGSLSQTQQRELMQSLETEGVAEIDHFMNISALYENPKPL